MTKQEFIDTIGNFDELCEFCRVEHLADSLDWYYDIYDYYGVRGQIEEDIKEALNSNYWYDIRDMLNDIPENGDWFKRLDTLVYICIDNDFNIYKDDVLQYMDRFRTWDEDEDETESETEAFIDTDYDTPLVVDEPFSLEELLFSTNIKGAV